MRWYSYSLAFFVVLISLSYVVSADLLVTAGWDSTKARLEVKNPDDLSTTCTYLASAPGGRATHMYGVAYVPTDGTVVMAGYWDVSRDWRYVKVRVTSGVPCSEVWSIEEDVPLSGYANAIVYGNGYVYAAGFDALSGRGNRIRVEKRDAITGALMWNYTSDPTTSDDVANAIAFDKSGYVYIAGTQGARAAWRIEKIDVTTGALVWAKTNSPPTAGQNNAEGIVFDPVENVIYVVGSDNFGSGRIRVEKRSAVTGDLVPGTSVYTNDPSVGEDRMLSAVFYNNYLYMGGWQRAEAIIRAEKLTSSLTNSWSYINDPGTSDVTRGLAVGGGSVYLSGSMSNHLALYDVKVDAVTGLDITKIGYKPGHEINWEASTYIITCTDADGDGYFAEGGTCGSVDCNDNNAAVHPGATEVCNGIDDNCNGQIDEEIAPIPTSCGVGACRATGTLSCVNGAIVDSCTVGAPAANDVICNGIDDDCDEQTDEDYASHATSCGIGACKSAGATSCVAGAEQDSCTAGTPSSETCNGIDDDCDGVADEDFPLGNACSVGIGACQASGIYICSLGNSVCSANEGIPSSETCNGIDDDCDGVADDGIEPITTSCGVGACQVSGTLSCVSGALVDSCTEGTAASDDTICNGIDDDCDGQTDEDYVSLTTNCGIGACESAGATSCVNGAVADSCTAGTAAADDATCNGIDDNCNGQTDEDYILTDTSCGVGACSSSGQMICSNGLEQDTCHSGIPADNDFSCDGVDNDCNGAVDDRFISLSTECGVGACHATGATSCTNGIILDSCTAGTPAANDATCNGIDDNCNGLVDDSYAPHDTSCGIGACESAGATSCVAGAEQDSCTAGTAAADDATCNGIDDNCNGQTDEEYVSLTTNCGVGACQVSGTTSCISGSVADSCVAGTPGADDATCNGIDDNCDGSIDENYASHDTSCGIGACESAGATSCVAGAEQDSCTAGTAAADDATCNGIDDNCNGQTDEDYILTDTSCGVGACSSSGQMICSNGLEQDTCHSGIPADNDFSCDGVDNDCDGSIDENYASHDTSCGIGACAATGITSCANGIILDSCTAGTPAANDATCDGIDDNCDGLIDENYASHDTSCGIGACGSLGTTSCEAGVILDSCTPSLPAIDDASCDGLDNDCDGFTDEDYVSLTTNCGVGVCRVSGTTSCISGNVTDSCVAGTPGADDANCDGMDNDCDEQTDEGYVPQNILCGVGACTATIVSSCSNGVEDTTCTPGAPSAEICNGKDDDCDGSTDENLGQTTCGLGQCYHTIENCAAGVPQSCDPMQGATTETCNGKDDDCDGQTDEGYDADKDGVNDCGDDLCLNTTTDTRVPLIRENPNHHVYVSGYPWYPASFTVNTGSAKKPVYEQSYSIVQTRGCSCEQILDAKYGNTLGQYKYTCTKGTMDNWIQTRGWAKPAITGSAVLESSGTGLRGLLCKWFGWFC